LIMLKHSSNINRLTAGNEDKLEWKKNG